jgi:MSHA biogenesis protein MshM
VYYDHFGLNAAPFRITPETQLFYTGGRRGLVLEALHYAIREGEGIIKVVGEVGSGKTMLCRMLAEKLPENIDVIYLANPHLSPDTILQAIALEMKLPVVEQTPPPDHLHVMQALHQALLEKHTNGRQAVALIEEAQGMPLATLEEIRLLSNLETTRHKLLQMVLFGQPELDDNLRATHIRQLKERITHSFVLAPFNREEIAEYIEFRLRAVGYKGPPLFSQGALKLLAHSSQGLLRRVNILADKALLAVFADGRHFVETRHMRRAIEDSGFLDYQRKNIHPAWLALIFTLLAASAGGLWLHQNPLFIASLDELKPIHVPEHNTEKEEKVATTTETNSPTTTDVKMTEATLPLLQQRLRATREWLAQADSTHYTLQVMEVDGDTAEAVERLLEAEALTEVLATLYVFRFARRDTTRWLLLYGDFSQREAALATLGELPPVLARNQPFARRLSSLQDKLGTP